MLRIKFGMLQIKNQIITKISIIVVDFSLRFSKPNVILRLRVLVRTLISSVLTISKQISGTAYITIVRKM